MRKLLPGLALAGVLFSMTAAHAAVVPQVSGYTVQTIATGVQLLGQLGWSAVDPELDQLYLITVLPSAPLSPFLFRYKLNGEVAELGPIALPAGTLKFNRNEHRLHLSHPSFTLDPGEIEILSTAGASLGHITLPVGQTYPNAPFAIGLDGRIYAPTFHNQSVDLHVFDSATQSWPVWRTIPIDPISNPAFESGIGDEMYMEFSASGEPMISHRGVLYRAEASGLKLITNSLLGTTLAVGDGFALYGPFIVDPDGGLQLSQPLFMTGAQSPNGICDDGTVFTFEVTDRNNFLGSIVALSRAPVATTKTSWGAVKQRFR